MGFSDHEIWHAETSERVRVCGRVQGVREVGKKLKFIDILQGESSVQVKMQNKADVYEGDFKADSKFLRRGDVIGIEGVPVRTNAGELSVLAASITLLRHVFWDFSVLFT